MNKTYVGIDDFTKEKECVFERERYSVRDNGAVLRHQPIGKFARVNDNQWTFGKENSSNPYLYISGVRIHRIVATAFHDAPPDPKYVIDHIDLNCRNNRPENLRWLSRLENALKNPATRKKIEYLCGSIEAFLENPSMLNELRGNSNFAWMRTVTPEEARNCKERMSIWADSTDKPRSSTAAFNRQSTFAKRVFKPIQKWEVGLDGEPGLELAKTPRCAQYYLRSYFYFPCCPKNIGDDPLEDYFRNITIGSVFSYSDYKELCPKQTVIESVLLKDNSSILVLCERADGKWSIIGISIGRSKYFIHFNLGSYSSKDEADKAFCNNKELKDYWSEAYKHQMDL